MNKLIRWEQLVHLISAHFKEIIREPSVLFWGIIFPILMSLGLGIAFTKKVDIVRNVALIQPVLLNMPAPRQASGIETFLHQKAEEIKSDRDEVRYKITIKDDQLGNITFLFQKTGWENAMTMMKRSVHMPTLTKIDPIHSATRLRRMKGNQNSWGSSTLQASRSQ